MSTVSVSHHPVVSEEEWRQARTAFLAKEKEFTRRRDELSRERRELPRVKIDKNYVFDGPDGQETLAQLFDGHSQLITYHFMLAPGWEEGCKGCSYLADHFDGSLMHLAHRDLTLVAVSRAPLPEIQKFKSRMGWQFKWVSSFGSDFNRDFHVSFSKKEGDIEYNYRRMPFSGEELPGLSVFYKDDSGEIFHTYSAYARGLDILVGTYNFLDLAPKGRDEDGLPAPMHWLRHHDRY